MKTAAGVVVMLLAVAPTASAARPPSTLRSYLCCDSVAFPDGSCVSSVNQCPASTAFGVSFHNLTTPEVEDGFGVCCSTGKGLLTGDESTFGAACIAEKTRLAKCHDGTITCQDKDAVDNLFYCLMPDGRDGGAGDGTTADGSDGGVVYTCPPPPVSPPSPCNQSRDVPFPAQTVGGYNYITTEGPRWGLCFLAPDANDPLHLQPATPLACLTTSLLPGVGAETAVWQFPDDPRWDAIEMCYGPPKDGSCILPAALNDPTLSLTPDGSCCAPPRVLGATDDPSPTTTGWTFDVGQEIPGVHEPYDTDLSSCVYPGCGQAPGDPGFTTLVPTKSMTMSTMKASSSGCSTGGGPSSLAGLLLLAWAIRRSSGPRARRSGSR